MELLLTLEEYCAEEGVFEGAGEAGPLFAAVFPQLLQQLYEGDVVDEDAFGAWAREKEHADAEERVYLQKVRRPGSVRGVSFVLSFSGGRGVCLLGGSLLRCLMAVCSGSPFPKRLYEGDVVDEGALGAWARKKEHADAEERVYLQKVRHALVLVCVCV